MIAREILDRFASIIGEDGFEEHEPVDVGGRSLAVTLRPGDGDALARCLDALSACGMSALVRGGGNRLGVGNLLNRCDAFLSTERLSGVDEFEPEEGVCHVRAGTRLDDAREVVRSDGWEFPLDAPGDTATCGGVIAAAAVGPRAAPPGSLRAAMATRLKRGGRRSRYRLRKVTVEPVFGQTKEARGFRQFLLRGLDKVAHEWGLVCIAHNLTKLAAAAP